MVRLTDFIPPAIIIAMNEKTPKRGRPALPPDKRKSRSEVLEGYRQRKREEGKTQVTVWLPTDVVARMDAIAHKLDTTRPDLLAELITNASDK